MHGKVRKARQGNQEIQEGYFFSGPIPSPDLMKEYAEVDPKFPERILTLTEGEASHRQREEKKINRCKLAEIRSDAIGRLAALVFAFLCIVGYGYLMYLVFQMGYNSSATFLSSTIVAALLYGFYRFTRGASKK